MERVRREISDVVERAERARLETSSLQEAAESATARAEQAAERARDAEERADAARALSIAASMSVRAMSGTGQRMSSVRASMVIAAI